MGSSDSRRSRNMVMSSHKPLGASPPARRASQVPDRPFRARCPLSPREAHRVQMLVASPMAAGFGFFGSVATSISVTRPNRVHLRCGSRVRLSRLRHDGYPNIPLDCLHGERASTMSTTFQVDRSVRLSLTHQRTQRQACYRSICVLCG